MQFAPLPQQTVNDYEGKGNPFGCSLWIFLSEKFFKRGVNVKMFIMLTLFHAFWVNVFKCQEEEHGHGEEMESVKEGKGLRVYIVLVFFYYLF